jgi:tRNA(fMet)-specific endonuclease VapC
MTLRYLLDTNVISEPLRPQPNPRTLEHLRQHGHEIAIAAIVWHELWYGCERLPPSSRRNAIEHYLTQVIAPTVPVLPYHEAAARWHGRERARLSALGRTPPFADGQIAAIAHTDQLILVTFNMADYADFSGLTLEDWGV